MALDRWYRVQCDRCRKVPYYSSYEPTPRAARREAKRMGWVRLQVGNDARGAVRQDLCPACVDEMAEESV